MNKPYRTLEEITDIFGITLSSTKTIIKTYKVDSFINKGKIYVHIKDFYKSYTKYFNPSLFATYNKKGNTYTSSKKNISEIFKELFSTPYKV